MMRCHAGVSEFLNQETTKEKFSLTLPFVSYSSVSEACVDLIKTVNVKRKGPLFVRYQFCRGAISFVGHIGFNIFFGKEFFCGRKSNPPRQLWQTTILLIGRKTFRLSQLVTKTWILLKMTQINSFLASGYLRVGEFSMKFAVLV